LYFVLIALGIFDFSALMEMMDDPALQAGGEPDPELAALVAQSMMQQFSILWLVSFVLNWLYEAILTSSAMQATPGKMAFGLRVTTVDGEQIGFGRATGRFFGKIVSSLILCIGFIMIAFSARKQGLHDMMAGTVVVRG
jgi:uncharacterized RDD family membrane protein YckC